MRVVGPLALAIGTGLVAFTFVFSDLAPGESVLLRVAIVVAVFGGGGFLVGWTAQGRWRLASVCAWTPIAMGVFMLSGKLQTGNTPPYWSAIFGFLFGPLLVSLFGGFLASRLRARHSSDQSAPS